VIDTEIDELSVDAYKLPLQEAHTDGTHRWDAVTLVLVQVSAAGQTGIGYTYNQAAAAELIHGPLRQSIEGSDPFRQREIWQRLDNRCRNFGGAGVVAAAIAAVDTAVWDLAARLVDLPLYRLLGATRSSVPLYGSGGFTSQSEETLVAQLCGWCDEGIQAVKMKVGPDRAADRRRVAAARRGIGADVELYVDANGAYDRKPAIAQAQAFAEHGVSLFEEPVNAQDFDGLRLIRDRLPAGMELSVGEYGYQVAWFRRLLAAGATDVLQADITRCAGVTGFLSIAELAHAHHLPLSTHTAPALHRHVALACPAVRNCEWFADHVGIERRFFDGAPSPQDGCMVADDSQPGHGLTPKLADLENYRVAP
jgi:L-alanine-DL-glutamate epimerase-like enolase superfamily enzyme